MPKLRRWGHFKKLALSTGLLLGTLTVSVHAQGQTTSESVRVGAPVQVQINGMLLGPAPGVNQPIEVRVMDDSPANLRLKSWMEAALIKRGYRLGGSEAPLLLTIDTNAGTISDPLEPSRASPMIFYGQRTGSQGEDDTDRSQRPFLSNETRPATGLMEADMPVIGIPGANVSVTLTERENGQQIWIGWGQVSDTSLGDGDKLLLLADPLANEVGQRNRAVMHEVPAGIISRP